MKQSDWVLTIVGVLALIWVFGNPVSPPTPAPPDKVDFPKPQGVFAEVPLASKYISGETAGDLAWFWRNFAIQFRDDAQITNTAMARNLHVHAGKALRRLLGEKVYSPEFSEDIEKFFDKTVGMENKNIDSMTREKIFSAFMAVAWSCNEAADNSLLVVSEKIDNAHCFSQGCLLDENELISFIAQINPQGPGKADKTEVMLRGPPENDLLTHGLIVDEVEIKEFVSAIPDFKEFGFEGTFDGKARLLYESLQKFDPLAYISERQVTGDCLIAVRNNMNLYGTRVRMADGLTKPIEDVVAGDVVINAHNQPSIVKSTFKKPYSGDLVELRLAGRPYPLYCTPDHLIRTSRNGREAWVRADELSSNDRVLVPFGDTGSTAVSIDLRGLPSAYNDIPERNIPVAEGFVRTKGGKHHLKANIPINDDMGWLLGIYLAEGGLRYENGTLMGVDFSLNRDEVDIAKKIESIFSENFGFSVTHYTWGSKPSVRIVRANSKLIAEFFDLLCPGKIDTKHLNPLLLSSPLSVRKSLVNGWLDGDGHLSDINGPVASGVSVSEAMVQEMQHLCSSLAIKTAIHKNTPKLSPGVLSRRPTYTLAARGRNALNLVEGMFTEKLKIKSVPMSGWGFEVSVKSISKKHYENIEVYCIEVPNGNSFVANDIAVHNCVSHATRNACDTVRAFEIDVLRETEDFVARGATEPIYGVRGHSGQGMSVVASVKFVSENGGVALRRQYPGVDLSTYNAQIGIEWGRQKEGTPDSLRQLLEPNQITKVSHISSVKDAADAIASGFALTVGSGYSFSATRDQYGIAKRTPQGWAHAMAWVAVASANDLMSPEGLNDYLQGAYAVEDPLELQTHPRGPDDPCFLIVNSWGTWNSGPKGKYEIPDGSFWITADNAAGMIKQNQAFALGDFEGFAPQSLDDWGFTPWLGKKDVNYDVIEPSSYYLAP